MKSYPGARRFYSADNNHHQIIQNHIFEIFIVKKNKNPLFKFPDLVLGFYLLVIIILLASLHEIMNKTFWRVHTNDLTHCSTKECGICGGGFQTALRFSKLTLSRAIYRTNQNSFSYFQCFFETDKTHRRFCPKIFKPEQGGGA